MQPRTKFHWYALKMNESIPPISEKQKTWAYEHCLYHAAKLMKRGLVCLDCGHAWEDKMPKAKTDICPNCGRKVTLERSKKRVFTDQAYFSITTTWKGNQVFRLYFVKVKYQNSKKPDFVCQEVVQRWISPDGKTATFARNRNSFSMYYDAWCLCSKMELRGTNHISHYLQPNRTYPAVKYIPQIKRNGFKGDYHGMKPFDFYALILGCNPAETLLKIGEIEWFKMAAYDQCKFKRCWPAIKIAIRKKYQIKDKHLWLDYIDLLRYFEKDIRSPRYVCADDFREVHDQLVRKKRRVLEQKARERKKNRAVKEEADYQKEKGKFFGLVISDGLIDIKVLESVAEVIEEGDILHHCVFTNEYYKLPDSLLLSARINEKPIETIEFSLREKRVIQCRGECNRNTKYHDQIIKLVNDNIDVILKRKRLSKPA